MKVYTVFDSGVFNIIGVFTSLADAEECILLNSYYGTLYEFNCCECWDVETFNYKDWLNTMLAVSDAYLIEVWEI